MWGFNIRKGLFVSIKVRIIKEVGYLAKSRDKWQDITLRKMSRDYKIKGKEGLKVEIYLRLGYRK
jgi:hypothetical protein